MSENQRMTTEGFKLKLNLNGPAAQANAQYRDLCQHILAYLRTHNVLNKKTAGRQEWDELRGHAMTHVLLEPFTAKYKAPRGTRDPHKKFHLALDALLMDVAKKYRETLKNAGVGGNQEPESIAGPSTVP